MPLQVHAEGDCRAVGELVAFLQDGPPLARVAAVQIELLAPEGHEQFAIRGVSAGAFVVQEHAATGHHFDLRLEVAGVMRSWASPKGPSLDPAVKRLAVEVADHAKAHNTFEGMLDAGAAIVWDHGTYEQGGMSPGPKRSPRPRRLRPTRREAARRLRPPAPGAKAQWLLIKRRDQDAPPGSDIVAERPRSVLSDRRLEDLLR